MSTQFNLKISKFVDQQNYAKMGTQPVCNICLQSAQKLFEIGESPDYKSIKWITKLNSCVPEVKWDDSFMICGVCTTHLDAIYNFRNLCISSNISSLSVDNEFLASNVKEEYNHNDTAEAVSDDGASLECKEEFNCNFCEETFFNKAEILKHVQEHTKNSCMLCKLTFNTTSEIKNHIEEVHTPKPAEVVQNARKRNRISEFPCDDCEQVFSSSPKLIRHCVTEHSYNPADVRPFRCDICLNKFTSSSYLLIHKRYHKKIREFICPYCGKGFITSDDLSVHEKSHLNKREYSCEKCLKTYNTHKNLRTHRLVVHTNPSEWNYVCPYCDKRSPIRSNHNQHVRTHTGERLFACHLCDKRFGVKGVLKKHIASHSNIRAYKCQHCDKEYKAELAFNVHLKRDHNIGNAKVPVRVKRHFCHICPKSYFDKNKLTRHLLTHAKGK